MTHPPPMVEWPTQEMIFMSHLPHHERVINYERAMKEAAMARLRVAVEALEKARYDFKYATKFNEAMDSIDDALDAIGPLPPLADEVGG
jgi:hypothetical protein